MLGAIGSALTHTRVADSLKKPHHIVTLWFSEVVKDHANTVYTSWWGPLKQFGQDEGPNSHANIWILLICLAFSVVML